MAGIINNPDLYRKEVKKWHDDESWSEKWKAYVDHLSDKQVWALYYARYRKQKKFENAVKRMKTKRRNNVEQLTLEGWNETE